MFVRARNCLANYPTCIIKNDARKYMASAIQRPKHPEGVEYPPLTDESPRGRRRKVKTALAEKFKQLETVEEKIYALNMPRYYGWRALLLREGVIPFNALPQAQYITRTHVVEDKRLPDYYNNLVTSDELDSMVQGVKGQIEDCIAFEHSYRIRKPVVEEDGFPPSEEKIRNAEKQLGTAIVQQINRILLANFSSNLPHLFQAQIDYEPRVDAFWFTGGIHPPDYVRKPREGSKFHKNRALELVDRAVQYVGSPILQLRHELPLKQIVTPIEARDRKLVVPKFKYQPEVLGYCLNRQRATITPGFWPGDPSEFGLLSFHNRDYLLTRKNTFRDTSEALTVQAIFASYGWLYSQACYQGFSTYNDITYPLTTQTIITNGEWWSFCVYQLNTILLHSKFVSTNIRRNLCWMTEPMQLFEKVEDGKVRGFNDDVLKLLLKFYINAPEARADVDMKPYLGKTVKAIADIEDDDRRMWLERTYKHLMSNRSRHRRIPEISDWQKIFCMDLKMRPADRKQEPWEFGIKVMSRRLDDHTPAYIPKFKRADPKKKKIGRWEKTYYPDVKV